MFFYVYVLFSQKYKRLYIGYSSDVFKRLEQHNSGKSKATRPFMPYELIFYESFTDKQDAKAREVYLKSGWGRRSLHKMLKNTFIIIDFSLVEVIQN